MHLFKAVQVHRRASEERLSQSSLSGTSGPGMANSFLERQRQIVSRRLIASTLSNASNSRYVYGNRYAHTVDFGQSRREKRNYPVVYKYAKMAF